MTSADDRRERQRKLYEEAQKLRAVPPPEVIDPPTGRQLRDEAVRRVDAHADDDWRAHALDVVRDLAAAGGEFTTDDVWLALSGSDATTHEPRALGAVMQRAARLGLIVATSQWRQSTRPVCHASPKRVWRPTHG